MPKRQRLGWYSFYKKGTNLIRAVVPNPPPIDAKPPVRLPCGALFFDKTRPQRDDSLAPIIHSRIGTLKSKTEIEEMQRLHQSDPKKWTLDALAGKFNMPRSFIINKVFSRDERLQLELEDGKRLLQMPMNQIKGCMMSARIRQVRNNSF